jgi:hypothetical protein
VRKRLWRGMRIVSRVWRGGYRWVRGGVGGVGGVGEGDGRLLVVLVDGSWQQAKSLNKRLPRQLQREHLTCT